MTGDVENFVDSTKNLLESIRDFGEVAGYKNGHITSNCVYTLAINDQNFSFKKYYL